MEELIELVKSLLNTEVNSRIEKRLSEFKKLGEKERKHLFSELAFCILTANFDAKRAIEIQDKIEKGFLNYSEGKLAKKLKELGYRFPNKRAEYIVEARKHLDELESIKDKEKPRKWLVENIKGLGYKEASHFLRNIGFGNYAIIDFHIIDILERHRIVEKPKTLTKGKYLKIEKILSELAEKLTMSLAELDLYLWFLETGKILK
ncbi:MAG: N-glycosylase/DNA lyase [Candidatus Undinarchaeales archaeon]